MAAIVEATIDDVCSVLLKMLGAYKSWVIVLVAANEFVLVLMAAIVDVMIDDVCSVLLKIRGV